MEQFENVYELGQIICIPAHLSVTGFYDSVPVHMGQFKIASNKNTVMSKIYRVQSMVDS